MRKEAVFVSFFLVVSYCQAQYPGQLFFSTPAQSDGWERSGENFAPSPPTMERPSGESVSVARLRHVPSRDARRAFLRGLKDAQAGATREAVREFQRSVTFDPEFAEAHCNLGVEYTALGLLDEAVSALRRALELDPATGVHHANLAYALIRINREDEAEREAQTAVDLDPSYAKGQFLLGFLLARRPQTRRLAAAHLADAARQLPEAHFLLAEMYLDQGDSQIAAEELDRYQKAFQSRAKNQPHQARGLSFQ
jgi:tetratricopeptide (TPR) repeat protein